MDRQKKLLLHIGPAPIDCLLIPSCMVLSLVCFTRIIHRANSLCLQGLAYSLWLTIFNTGTLCMDFSNSISLSGSLAVLDLPRFPKLLEYKLGYRKILSVYIVAFNSEQSQYTHWLSYVGVSRGKMLRNPKGTAQVSL